MINHNTAETGSGTRAPDKLNPVEGEPQATPTTAVPGDIPAFPGTSAPGAPPVAAAESTEGKE